MANLRAEAGNDRLLHIAGIDAEPIPELEFDQALGWESCAVEIAHAAARWRAGCRHWRPAASGVGCQFRTVGSVQFFLLLVSKLCEDQTKAVFDLKLMVGGGEHKMVFEESVFRVYCDGGDWGLNFQSVVFCRAFISNPARIFLAGSSYDHPRVRP